MHRHIVRTIALALACCLAGCSLLYSYNAIDRYFDWLIDDYIAWDDAQEVELRSRLTAQFAWHQKTQLPRYRAWLATVDSTLDADIDATQLAEAADQLQGFWEDTAAHLHADACALLASLSDRQAADLIAAIREGNAERKDEYDAMTPEELVWKRQRRMTKTLKYWLGSLDEDQRAMIAAWAYRLEDSRALWLNNRERWTDSFEQALRHRREPRRFAEEIDRLMVTPQQTWEKELRELSYRNRDLTFRLLADVHNSRSPRQRDVERKRATQWLERLDRLARSDVDRD